MVDSVCSKRNKEGERRGVLVSRQLALVSCHQPQPSITKPRASQQTNLPSTITIATMGKVRQRRATSDKQTGKGDSGGTNASQRSSSRDPHEKAASASDPTIISLIIYLIKVFFLSMISLPFCLATEFLSRVYGRPPKMVFLSQTHRFLQYTIHSTALSSFAKADLIMTILLHTVISRVSGLCWLLDEFLYSKQMNSISIIKPLFVMSAYRSASTEMARTLAKDTNRFVAPSAIMCAFPYLWLWNLVTYIVGEDSGISIEEANGYLNKNFTAESLERHDNNHFAIDTFDGYFLSSHLNGLSFHLGADIIVKEFNYAKFEEHDRYLFEHCFVEHVDRIARKTLIYNGIDGSSAANQTFLLKGHFLQSANALQNRYPDACFLSVLRDPLDRLQSGINHMAVNATLWRGRLPNWEYLTDAFQQIEIQYCELEMEWYRNDNPNRFAVKFEDFIKNTQKTLNQVYIGLLKSDGDGIPHFNIPSKHEKKKYTVNRSLVELGVDESKLKGKLAEYYNWMKKQ
jgi:hypothetical protein